MFFRRVASPTPKDIEYSSDANALEEMCYTMDALHRLNQTLEDNVHNIQQYQ